MIELRAVIRGQLNEVIGKKAIEEKENHEAGDKLMRAAVDLLSGKKADFIKKEKPYIQIAVYGKEYLEENFDSADEGLELKIIRRVWGLDARTNLQGMISWEEFSFRNYRDGDVLKTTLVGPSFKTQSIAGKDDLNRLLGEINNELGLRGRLS